MIDLTDKERTEAQLKGLLNLVQDLIYWIDSVTDGEDSEWWLSNVNQQVDAIRYGYNV